VVRLEVNSLTVAILTGLFVGLTACQGAGDQDPAESSLAEDAQRVIQEKDKSIASMNLNEQMSIARKDLAERLGIELDSITLTAARQVTWRSGALGCPKPGMSYTQALVPGVLILLNVGDDAYGYHAKTDGKPFYCPRERIEIPASIQAEDMA
jgi:hypothetical protein